VVSGSHQAKYLSQDVTPSDLLREKKRNVSLQGLTLRPALFLPEEIAKPGQNRERSRSKTPKRQLTIGEFIRLLRQLPTCAFMRG
jgi:hypothetical protein